MWTRSVRRVVAPVFSHFRLASASMTVFGPGAGSVLMFALVRWFGFDFLRAAATTKVLNLASNFAALVLFMMTGNVLYAVALPMAAFNVAGGFLGAHLAVRRGSRFIRSAFLLVVVVLLAKIVFDIVKVY